MSTRAKALASDAVLVASRAALAVAFIWACIHKIANPYDFAMQVATYQILPLEIVNLQAIVLPWVELATGVLLVLGLWTRPAALVTCGMNLMFIVAIAMALDADLHLQCGCFSSAEAGHEMSPELVVRDSALFLAGALLVVRRPDRFTLDALLERRRSRA
jgi:putative oxidoreductase